MHYHITLEEQLKKYRKKCKKSSKRNVRKFYEHSSRKIPENPKKYWIRKIPGSKDNQKINTEKDPYMLSQNFPSKS